MLHIQVMGPARCEVKIDADWNQKAFLKYKGEQRQVAYMKREIMHGYGMFGHPMSDETTPLDVLAFFKGGEGYVFEILEQPEGTANISFPAGTIP